MPTKFAVRQFLRYSQRYADNTQRQYRDTLWRFSDQMPEFVDLITAEHIDQFLQSLKILNSSKNTILIPVKSFFRYLYEFHDIENVAEKVKFLPEQPAKQRVITEKELEKILKVASGPEKAVIKFLSNTGLRAQEFCDLTHNIGEYLDIIGKGKRRRVVPLNETAKSCIPTIFYKRHTRDSLSWMMKKLTKKAGIPLAGPHSLRHRFVTQMIRKGVSRTIVARVAGMSETILEKTYCHLLTSDFLGVTDVLD